MPSKLCVLLITVLFLACSDAQGSIYGWAFGGDFLVTGTDDISSAIIWQNGSYHSIGGGVPYTEDGQRTGQEVQVIAEYGGSLYIGGDFFFKPSGSKQLSRVARWDGKKWDNMHGGLPSPCSVDAIAFYSDLVFVGVNGQCNTTSGVEVSGIAVYSPKTGWSNMQGGLRGLPAEIDKWATTPFVNSMIVTGSDDPLLVVGGFFVTAGIYNASLLAVWNLTAEEWSPLSDQDAQLGLLDDLCQNYTLFNRTFNYCYNPTVVTTLAPLGSNVLVGGQFVPPNSEPSGANAHILLWSPTAGYTVLPNTPTINTYPSSTAIAADSSAYIAVGADILFLAPTGAWTSLKNVSTVYSWPWLGISELHIDPVSNDLYAFGVFAAFASGLLVFSPTFDQHANYTFVNSSMWFQVVVPSVENAIFTTTPVSKNYIHEGPKEEPISRVFIAGVVCGVIGFIAGGLLYFVGKYSANAKKQSYERIP